MREIFQTYSSLCVNICKIIVVQSDSVKTDFERKPSATTLLYLPFENDLTDKS